MLKRGIGGVYHVVRPPQDYLRALSMLWYIIPDITKKPEMNAGTTKEVWMAKSQIEAMKVGITKVPSFTSL